MGGRARSLGSIALVVAALVAAVIAGAGRAEAQGTTRRVAGADRYKTMEALVREGFASSDYDNTDIMTTLAARPEVAGGAPFAFVDITRAVPGPLRRPHQGPG